MNNIIQSLNCLLDGLCVNARIINDDTFSLWNVKWDVIKFAEITTQLLPSEPISVMHRVLSLFITLCLDEENKDAFYQETNICHHLVAILRDFPVMTDNNNVFRSMLTLKMMEIKCRWPRKIAIK